MGLFSRKSTDDEEDWTTECRNCGATATNWNFCSDACAEEHWEKSQANAPRYNSDPNCPVCGGAGSCKLCEDNAE
ncbi:MAG: hypothetical protein U0R76_07435 [Candidatus Nanopelagicales bacterium]